MSGRASIGEKESTGGEYNAVNQAGTLSLARDYVLNVPRTTLESSAIFL